MLRQKIQQFFSEVDSDPQYAEDLPTPSRLALYLGYASAREMYKDINDPAYPEYSMLLDRAVDLITDTIQRRQLRLAEKRNDWEGVDAVLQRIDKAMAETRPVKDDKKELNININIEKREKMDSFLSSSIDKLMMDAEFEDVKEPVALPDSVNDSVNVKELSESS